MDYFFIIIGSLLLITLFCIFVSSRRRRRKPHKANPLPPAPKPVHVTFGHSSGPDGLRPENFPCCPFDKQRNLPGEAQKVFWDSIHGNYYCTRGHVFKKNGQIMSN